MRGTTRTLCQAAALLVLIIHYTCADTPKKSPNAPNATPGSGGSPRNLRSTSVEFLPSVSRTLSSTRHVAQPRHSGGRSVSGPQPRRVAHVKPPPYAVQMEPLVQYSQRDPLYKDSISKKYSSGPSVFVNHHGSSSYSNNQQAFVTPHPPHSENYYGSSVPPGYIIVKEPEPIIEIIVREANHTLPPPPVQATSPKPREPVHVFYVKYKKDEHGKGVQYDKPIPAVTPATTVLSSPAEEHPVYSAPVTPGPPPATTTLRTIIQPDSEKIHVNTGGLRITFGEEGLAGQHHGGGHHHHHHAHDSHVELHHEEGSEPQPTFAQSPAVAASAPSVSAPIPTPGHSQPTKRQQPRFHSAPFQQHSRFLTPPPVSPLNADFRSAQFSGFSGPPERPPSFAPFSSRPSFSRPPSFPSKLEAPQKDFESAPFPTSVRFSSDSFSSGKLEPVPFKQLSTGKIEQTFLGSGRFESSSSPFSQNPGFDFRPLSEPVEGLPPPPPPHTFPRQPSFFSSPFSQGPPVRSQPPGPPRSPPSFSSSSLAQPISNIPPSGFSSPSRPSFQPPSVPQTSGFSAPSAPSKTPSFSSPSSPQSLSSFPSQSSAPQPVPLVFSQTFNVVPTQQKQTPTFFSRPQAVPQSVPQVVSTTTAQTTPAPAVTPSSVFHSSSTPRQQEHVDAEIVQSLSPSAEELQAQQQEQFRREQEYYKEIQRLQEEINERARTSTTTTTTTTKAPPVASKTTIKQQQISFASTPRVPSSATSSPQGPSTTTEAPKFVLPDEVPEDLRQQLLSSGILNSADIQILDYDKVGDIPFENLPPEALQQFVGATGGQVPSASAPSPQYVAAPVDRSGVDDSVPAATHESERRVTQGSPVEVKVVRFAPGEEHQAAAKLVRDDATLSAPVALDDNSFSRYLPLQVAGTSFPLPDVPELKGRRVNSVVVLAPVAAPVRTFARRSDNVAELASDTDVQFVAGESLTRLVKEPSARNFQLWLDQEQSTAPNRQSVILLVAEKEDGNEDEKEIFMYDVNSRSVSRLQGELSSAFVEVALANSGSQLAPSTPPSESGKSGVTSSAKEAQVSISSSYSKTKQ